MENSTVHKEKEITWISQQKGLSYSNILVDAVDKSRKEFFLVKIDPKLFEFRVYNNSDQSKAKSLQQINKEMGAVLTFNGAFFDTKFKAMGLLQDLQSISHRQTSSKLMNGIFYIGENFASGVRSLDNPPKDNNAFMIQNGPILIDDAGIIALNTDTEKLAARTALGVDGEGNIILIILYRSLLNTDNTLSLYQFAHLLKNDPALAPLNLHSVLNLDGGPSTGVVVGDVALNELNDVENAVFVLPRQN